MSKQPPTPEEYYDPVLKNFPSINNKNARAVWFEETEPPEGLPTHSRILHTAKAEMIAKIFIAGLLRDIHANSRYAWKTAQKLPNPEKLMPGIKAPLQPLAEGKTALTA